MWIILSFISWFHISMFTTKKLDFVTSACNQILITSKIYIKNPFGCKNQVAKWHKWHKLWMKEKNQQNRFSSLTNCVLSFVISKQPFWSTIKVNNMLTCVNNCYNFIFNVILKNNLGHSIFECMIATHGRSTNISNFLSN